MFTKIMIPVDLKHVDQVRKAIEVAAELAKKFSAEAHIVGVTMSSPTEIARTPEAYAEKLAAFASEASDGEIVDYNRSIAKVCDMTEIAEGGFRLIANAGFNGVQEVPHLHIHVLGGRPLGRMLTKA